MTSLDFRAGSGRPRTDAANNPPLCPYCFAHSQHFISSSDRNRHTTRDIFHYYQCCGCALVFIDPIPADLGPFYKGGYQAIPTSLAELKELAGRERYRMKPILRYKKSGTLLDIGPWIGIFACNAKNAGFDVTAIEMDPGCVDFLKTTLGIRALQSSDPANSLGKLEDKFDVITLWHSLEHLRKPWLMIEQAAKHLAPGGILLVSIPNIESYQYAILKGAWKHLDAPRHLYFYPIESLMDICRKCGLHKVEATTADEVSKVLSDDTWYSLADSLLPIRYARAVLFRLLRYAARRKECSVNAGAGLTAVFQLSTARSEGTLVEVGSSSIRPNLLRG